MRIFVAWILLSVVLSQAGCSRGNSNATDDNSKAALRPTVADQIPPYKIDPTVDRLWGENIGILEAFCRGEKILTGDYVRAATFLETTSGITAHDDISIIGGRGPTERVKSEDVPRWKEWYRMNAPLLYFDKKTGLIRVDHDTKRAWNWRQESDAAKRNQ